jgi:predicted metal-dependent hydrolase
MNMFELENHSGETTSEQLKQVRQSLALELETAINEGDADDLIRLDLQVRNLTARIFANQLSELKAAIEQNNARKAVIAREINALREIKGLRNRQLGRAMMVVNRRQMNVSKAQFAIEIAENELESIRVGNREMKKRLDDMKQTKLREVENGQFRTIF